MKYARVLLMKKITEHGGTADLGSMKKERTLPSKINLSD
jgi:hypothetical protein